MNRKNEFYVGQHSCYLLQYHLVLVTKYRRKVLLGPVKEDLTAYAGEFFAACGCDIQEINTDLDHVHILFDAPPQVCLSKFIGAFKSSSSRRLRTRHREFLSRFYWKPLFWSDSYFITTVSERTEDVVRRYIKSQGRK